MIIPRDPVERQHFYDDLVRQCTASRSSRFSFYQALRNFYLFGTPDARGTPYNKIWSTIDTLCSFIYSPDSTRFALHLGTTASADDIYKAIPLAKEVMDQWRASRTHLRFAVGIRWALVFGTMLIKVSWHQGRTRTYLVEPHQFGVLREDVTDLEDQEAFVHHYTITRTQLESMLEGNPRKASIMNRVGAPVGEGRGSFSEGLSRLLLSGPVSGVPGSVAIGTGGGAVSDGLGGSGSGPAYDYAPRVEAELVDMCELYVWNDEAEDYQLVTIASPNVVVFDRPQEQVGHVKGLPSFVTVRPEENLYDYFWGSSFVAPLTWLQEWRSTRTFQIQDLLAKQVDPPMSITGGAGIQEEKLLALRRAGGQVPFATPTAKVEVHAPSMPPNVFTELDQIDRMFDDLAGIGHVLQGKGEPGVRSRGQADLMARLGSARPKERAIVVEEAAEDVARLILRTVQDHSPQRFHANIEGKALPFVAEQFTKDYEVKVDAHSSSPIFIEDRKHDARDLLEARAIDRETLLDMFDPPNLQELKERLKVMEQKEAEQAKMQMQMEASRGKK